MAEAVVVTYRTSPMHAAENARLVGEVFDQLRREQPAGLRYAAFRLGPATFLHVALLDDPHGNPLTTLTAFHAFQQQLGLRCEEPPAAERGVLVDSYGWLTGPA